jgi:hypothetical protein
MEATEKLTEREEMIQIYSDFYKDAHGSRPRYINYHEFTLEELKADFKYFGELCKENRILEEAAEKGAISEFDSLVKKTISLGAGDRKTALKWLFDGSELNVWEVDHFVWGCGFLFTDEGKSLLAELTLIVSDKLEHIES